MAKSKPEIVSSKPLFDWFKEAKLNRKKMRDANYTDARITNWQKRGIPRGEVGKVANLMGLNFEQYMALADPEQPTPKASDGELSQEAIEIARAFDRMEPQTQAQVRQHVFIYSVIDRSFPWLRLGRPVSANYGQFEKWHSENFETSVTVRAQSLLDKGKAKG